VAKALHEAPLKPLECSEQLAGRQYDLEILLHPGCIPYFTFGLEFAFRGLRGIGPFPFSLDKVRGVWSWMNSFGGKSRRW